MNPISVKNVSKRFGSQVVLKNVSLEIEPEKITAIVGPSGVGKSVLLKLIMGILKPECGDILLYGKSIVQAKTEDEMNRLRACLGVLFQSAALFDSMSVFDNIAFPLIQRVDVSLTRSEIEDRVIEMLNSLSLTAYASRYPEELSIGIRKRVGMARALITEPSVFLFDEPNTGLDPLVGQEVYDLINECREKWKFAGLVVSHELPEVFQVSDQVVMLLHGELVAQGSPAEISASDNPVVRQFLRGEVNGPIRIQ